MQRNTSREKDSWELTCNFALFSLGCHGSGLVFGGLLGRVREMRRCLAQMSVQLLEGGGIQARFTVAGGCC